MQKVGRMTSEWEAHRVANPQAAERQAYEEDYEDAAKLREILRKHGISPKEDVLCPKCLA